ncbi:MAG: hypothetical protein ABSF94_10845 [Steroidobacteraceae bacterium]
MNRRILLCGLAAAALVLTLALCWYDGLWRSDAEAPMRTAAQPPVLSAPPPVEPAPATAPVNPPAATAAAEAAQSEPDATPAVDQGERLARRERGGEHGARTR